MPNGTNSNSIVYPVTFPPFPVTDFALTLVAPFVAVEGDPTLGTGELLRLPFVDCTGVTGLDSPVLAAAAAGGSG